MSNNDILKETFDYYLANITELAAKYKGEFIVLKNCAVIGSYSSFEAAYDATIKTEEPGTFLIQQASTDKSAYTITYANVHIVG